MNTNEDVNEVEDELKQLNFLAALKTNNSGTLLPPPGWRHEMVVEGCFLYNNCSYQTNSSSNLNKHMLLAEDH